MELGVRIDHGIISGMDSIQDEEIRALGDGLFIIDIKPATEDKARTLAQNASIHKYCAMLADDFNSAGYDLHTILNQAVARQWTPEAVKELIWREVQKALYDKESTTKLNTKEVSKVYEVVSQHLAQTFDS